eukprot:m.128870 g.128870  ORF g.128870 m.128870 type:complete len:298 (+) comp13880_c0_seq1:235-1128(+)
MNVLCGMSELEIRAMTQDELGIVIEWAAAEGWNPGLHDAVNFACVDPEGMLMGHLDGKPVAAIFACRYSDSLGYIGCYIVRKEYRGRGYGLAVWNAGMARLKGCNVCLDGVLDQQANYMRQGFHITYRNARFKGYGTCSLDASPPTTNACERSQGVYPLTPSDVEDVVVYDRPFFPVSRDPFVKQWLNQQEGLVLIHRTSGAITGYVVARPCIEGFKLGPLCADTPTVAELLMVAIRSRIPADQAIFLDLPQPNRDAVALAKRHDMHQCFETARMYTKGIPPLAISRQYGITTFELG